MNLLQKLNDFIRPMSIEYAICGGGAIDLFAGYETRSHKDLDVSVFWDDRNNIIQYMLDMNWVVFEACGRGILYRIVSTDNQKKVKRNIFCLKSMDTKWCLSITPIENNLYMATDTDFVQTALDYIEFLFNTTKDNLFLYARNHEITLETSKAVLWSNGIPYLAPELVLLYKSVALNNSNYQLDFDVVLPLMDTTQIQWLSNALCMSFPDGHEWLDRLEASNEPSN